jgi:hypothetical protein
MPNVSASTPATVFDLIPSGYSVSEFGLKEEEGLEAPGGIG